MRAVDWVRSRQEERELDYWLSFVAYEKQDRSFINRLYLIYLVLFFSVWIFAMLTFFASGGAAVLRLLSATDPSRAAVPIEVALLGAWNVYALWQACRCSPVVFTEADQTLICQTSVNRRFVTIRWLLMPWSKSAIVFWIAAIIIGFSVAEISIPGVIGADRILEYARYGFRPFSVILPIQLGLFIFQWVIGIYRLQRDISRLWLGWIVIPASFLCLSYLLMFGNTSGPALLFPWTTIAQAITHPLGSGFGEGSLFLPILDGVLFALLMFAIMTRVSGPFSLTRAAQETVRLEALSMAQRYGFDKYAEDIRTQRRLGVERAPSRLPAIHGTGSLVWKGLLQSQRSFHLSSLLTWFSMFILMLGLPLLPDMGSRILAIAFWVIQLGQASVVRLRSDLSLWPLLRQLPISSRRFLLADLGPAYFLSILVSLCGLTVGSLLSTKPSDPFAFLVPGIVAAVAGIAAFDVMQRSNSNLLLAGSVPAVSGRGIALGLLITAIVLVASFLLPGFLGIIIAIVLSLVLGWMAFALAARSYRNIGSS